MKAVAQLSVMQRHGLPACETEALTLSVQTMPCKAQMQRLYPWHTRSCTVAVASFLLLKRVILL